VTFSSWNTAGGRWLRFNFVGAVGIAVQLVLLALLTRGLDLNYLWATALAVELTVVHNFLWHRRFTWADRVSGKPRDAFLQLARFNLSTGTISVGGNLVFMFCLVGLARLPALPSNLISVAVCSVLNFLAADRWAFRQSFLAGPPASFARHGNHHSSLAPAHVAFEKEDLLPGSEKRSAFADGHGQGGA